MSDRVSWDEVWMEIAAVVAKRSGCVRRQFGAVVVSSTNRIVAVGYNGPPAGHDGDCAGRCPRSTGERTAGYENCIALHAEANSLLVCDRREREGGTIYLLAPPCWECTRLIANSGLARVVTQRPEIDDLHRNPVRCLAFFVECGLEVSVRGG